jgi:acyl-coenzyme A thioesterase PaaI-like protein
MSAITDAGQGTLHATRSREHPDCIVCGRGNPYGLRLHFDVLADGSTEGQFDCDKAFEGYSGVIHGGVLSALVDGAMLHCLFARGEPALTVALSMQFRHPVVVGVPALVRAELLERSHSICTLAAEIVQNGRVSVRATGRFFSNRRPDGAVGNADENGNDHNNR